MVDRKARNKMAVLLRQFIAGRITNDDMCDNLPISDIDQSVNKIECFLQISFEDIYSKPYKLSQCKPLSREERRELARIVMFLYTDLEMAETSTWDQLKTLAKLLILPVLIVYGICHYIWNCLCGKSESNPDDKWPFASPEDYEEALEHPRLLCGERVA